MLHRKEGSKSPPKRKKRRTTEWLSDEASQTAEERRDVERKGERGRYIQLNAGFQRRAGRDKETFLSEPCKEIEENN